jgi:hypothetical protein
MPALADIMPQGKRVDGHRPWPRIIVTADAWCQVTSEVSAGRATLLGLWADSSAEPCVHMAIMADTTGEIAVLTLACPAGTFPSIGALHPPAIRLERAIRSLYGFEAVGALDTRPWSSRAIFALPRVARQWCGSNSGLAMCTRASSR